MTTKFYLAIDDADRVNAVSALDSAIHRHRSRTRRTPSVTGIVETVAVNEPKSSGNQDSVLPQFNQPN
jgi:hypothetical protein